MQAGEVPGWMSPGRWFEGNQVDPANRHRGVRCAITTVPVFQRNGDIAEAVEVALSIAGAGVTTFLSPVIEFKEDQRWLRLREDLLRTLEDAQLKALDIHLDDVHPVNALLGGRLDRARP